MKLRNMTGVYLSCDGKMLLLYRQDGRVVSDTWAPSAGGHFEKDELNDPEACVLRELYEELGLARDDIENLRLRYVGLRNAGEEIRQNYYFFADLKPGKAENLASNEGQCRWVAYEDVLSRDMLLNRVCGYDYVGETNVVDVYIRYLRSKIDDVFGVKMIQTVRGVGYVIKTDTDKSKQRAGR